MLHKWKEETYLYIQIFSQNTWRAKTASKTDAETGENFKINIKEIRKVVDRVGLTQNRIQWWTFVKTNLWENVIPAEQIPVP
jgi:hypothetical protein